MVLPNAQSLTEDLSRVGGFIAGCGQASALVVAHIVNGTPISVDELTQTIKDSINANVGATVHGSTAQTSQWILSQHGIQSSVTYNPSNLQSLINNALSQNKPVELGVNYGAALTGEPSNLRGHYVTVVGENSPTSFLVADPNTAQSKTGNLVTDTLQQLQSSNPFAAIIPNTGAGPGSTSGGIDLNPLDVPSNIANSIAGAISALPQGLFDTIKSGIIGGVESQTGLTSLSDLGWRAVLIYVGVFLVSIAMIFIVYDLLDKSNIEIAGSRV